MAASGTADAATATVAPLTPLAGYPDLMTAEQMAEVLDISRRNVYRLVERGELPFSVRVGRRVYFPKRLVIEFLRLAEGDDGR